MKRIELVIELPALERFTEAAEGLNLGDFDVTEVRRATFSSRGNSRRLYRGSEFVPALVERLKVDLTVADDAATRIAHELIENVRPESIAILRLDHAATLPDDRAARAPHLITVPHKQGWVAAQ